MFGHTWASQYGEKPEGITADTWAGVLAGVSGQQIAAGLHACAAEGREFPPNAPRFRAMCLGIPSFARVRIEITQADVERSPFARSVWMFVDGYAYRHASARDGERILQAAYDIAHDLAMQGHPLPEPAAGEIAHEEPAPLEIPETKEARVDRMRALLGESFSPEAAMAADEDEIRRKHRGAGKMAAAEQGRTDA